MHHRTSVIMNKRYTTVDELIRLWKDVANKKGYVLNERYSKKFSKPLYEIAAKSVLLTMGRCPCLPRERPVFPCDEMDEDIKKKGHCFCKVFFDPNWDSKPK